MNNKRYFVHILWHDELKFNVPFVNRINCESEYFDSSEHLFVTPHTNVYDALKHYGNVVLAKNNCNLINKYGSRAKGITVHYISGCNKFLLLFTRRKFMRKTIIRTWGGGELRPTDKSASNTLREVLYKKTKNIYNWIYRKKISSCYAIGTANFVDEVDIERALGRKIKTYAFSYAHNKVAGDYGQLFANMKKQGPIQILVGNSANIRNKHLEMLELLEKYKNNDIRVNLILSYGGDDEYISLVKKKATLLFQDKVCFLEEYLDKWAFAEFVSKMDIGIIADSSSRALGLLTWLSYFKKKVFVEKAGVICQALQSKNIEVNNIEDICTMPFDAFVHEDAVSLTKMKDAFPISSNEKINIGFKRMFLDLETDNAG